MILFLNKSLLTVGLFNKQTNQLKSYSYGIFLKFEAWVPRSNLSIISSTFQGIIAKFIILNLFLDNKITYSVGIM